MKRFAGFAAAAAATAFAAGAGAGTGAGTDRAETAPDDALARSVEELRAVHGRWSVTTEFLNPDGSVASTAEGSYEFRWIVPDRVLSGKSETPAAGTASGILLYVSEKKGVIEMVSVGADGHLWVMTGPLGGSARTTPEFPTSSGGKAQYRFTRYAVGPDSFESRMESTEDGGATWTQGNHQTFRRADAAVPEETVARAREAIAPFKKSLLAALTGALEKGGPEEAISICRTEAPAIARAASGDGIAVGRTSHRLRNPGNAPEDWMKPLLAAYLDDPGQASPRAVRLDGGLVGYVEPIRMVPLCVGCHGPDIAPPVQARLTELYPDDRATGFGAGDFRGMFWVTLPERVR